MIFRKINDLVDIPGYGRIKNAPIYLTDDHELIEAPTSWAADVAKRSSNSKDTLIQVSYTFARWLQFLDDNYKTEIHKGALYWQAVDRTVVDHFVDTLIASRDEKGSPTDETIEKYMSRITDFYRWADKKGYSHYWDLNNEEFKRVIQDRNSISMKKTTVTGFEKEVELHRGEIIRIDKEMNKFVLKQDFKVALHLFDDYVYAVMAYVLWNTALRPKELFQVPYKGTGLNIGLKPYRVTNALLEKETGQLLIEGSKNLSEIFLTDDERSEPLANDLFFEFESKGKRRSILFPLHVWKFICEVWMPLRAKRAERYANNAKLGNGISPSNSVLFLSEEGVPVTYTMLHEHFTKVARHPSYVNKPFTPKMLRHSFATYFVHNHMKVNKELGKEYIYNAVTDEHLRKIMGHTDKGTTYKFYVHLINTYILEDVVSEVIKEIESELRDEMIALSVEKMKACV